MAAAHAVADSILHLDAGSVVAIEDVLRDCRHFPLEHFPDMYGPLVNRWPGLWSALWGASDYAPTADALSLAGWPLVSGYLEDLARRFRPDVLVPVHPLLVRPAVRLAEKHSRLMVACVVTDLVRLHHFWLNRRVDLYCLPTQEAARAARTAGVLEKRLVVCGQPIPLMHPRALTQGAAKEALGLDTGRPLVLVSGGGAGAGPLFAVSEELAAGLRTAVSLVVICGRNHALRQRLARAASVTRVLGYVEDMPLWLRAADVLVTKAGPNALAEAMAEGLPTVIMAALPGQETDNVRYYRDRGAALWAPDPESVTEAVERLLAHPLEARALRRRAAAVSRPEAAALIAGNILGLGTLRRSDHREKKTRISP